MEDVSEIHLELSPPPLDNLQRGRRQNNHPSGPSSTGIKRSISPFLDDFQCNRKIPRYEAPKHAPLRPSTEAFTFSRAKPSCDNCLTSTPGHSSLQLETLGIFLLLLFSNVSFVETKGNTCLISGPQTS